jgi:hypothetical protein
LRFSETETDSLSRPERSKSMPASIHGDSDIDSSGSLVLLLLIGSMASFICGLLNFGQGMSFAVLWNAARCVKLLDSDASFSKGIV